MPKKFSLGKNERLKSRKLIEQLFSEGKNFVVAPYRIYYFIGSKEFDTQNSTSHIHFGVGVSGKNFKKAVDRNKIKRLTREAYRLQKNELKETVSVNQSLRLFFIYTAKELPAFTNVKERVKIGLNKLIKLIDENNSSNS
jgi:ribonuclease P protein component